MKKLRILICIMLVLGCSAAFAACGGARLSKPGGLRIDTDALTLSWIEVPNARYYTVSFNGDERETRKNNFSLSALAPGDYTVKVKACGGDGYDNSDWSRSLSFTREVEPGFTFALINGKTEYEVTGMGSADGVAVVPDEYRGKPVTRIGKRAFANRSKLTSVFLGNNITEIGEQAFYNCSYLTSANIPESVTKIGKQAFQSCRLLEGVVTIPNGVTELGESAFAYCRSITGVRIGSGIKSIGDSAFSDCDKLAEIVLPDTVESVGEYAFSKAVEAVSLTMGAGLKTVGDYAFYGCAKLPEIKIGASVESVGKNAFADCTAVTSVTIPDSVLTIGVEAFYGCSELSSVSLGRNVESIGRNAFFKTEIWQSDTVKYDEDYVPTDDDLKAKLVYLGEGDRQWVIGCRNRNYATDVSGAVKDGTYGIAGGAFYRHDSTWESEVAVWGITLPDSVQIIDASAFAGSKKLQSVTIGKGVKKIGSYAFSNCSGLYNAYLGSYNGSGGISESSLEIIDNAAFNGCKSIKNITVPDTVKSIGTDAFKDTGLWEQISETNALVYADKWVVGYGGTTASHMIVNNMKADTVGIANYAFYNSIAVSVAIPDSVKYIGRGAFYGSKVLQSVNIPKSLKDIDEYTFYNCSVLKLDTIPSNVKTIGRSAFYGCESLGLARSTGATRTEFKIPDSVEYIGDYAFYDCGIALTDEATGSIIITGITDLIIGKGVKSIGSNAFANFVSLKSVTVGENVAELGERAFYNCVSLQTVVLPDSLKSVPKRTFYNCPSLTSVNIPDAAEKIDDYAFYRCESLSSISLPSLVTEIGDYAFYGCASLKSFDLASVSVLGTQAFRNCKSLTSMVINDNITAMGNHAFYGCSLLTVYTSRETAPEGWSSRWNSSYRPVVWGAKLDSENKYVVSVTITDKSLSNYNERTAFYDPARSGYWFDGWSADENATAGNPDIIDIASMPKGTVLYTVWAEM